MNRPNIKQALFALAGAAFFAGSGLLQPWLDAQSSRCELNPPAKTENYPFTMLLTMAPGGLRAPILGYLWIRAEDLKSEGRYYEAMQLADLICDLQPNFAGVWAFHAWNMAYNISVQTHTPEERWRWVYNAVTLLRDRGIPQNRKSIVLYKELGWIFYHKMGQYMDDMHMYYKRRMAAMMQRLLASPPYGTTAETIEWFRPIAQAPIDRDPRRQGQRDVQQDQLSRVLADPDAASLRGKLKAAGVDVGWGLLDAYNRLTRDEAVECTRVLPVKTASDADRALSDLINDPPNRSALDKLLAFTRAQLLWNVYRMDPDWMLKLMERLGPLDWRMAMTHAVYWATYGLHVCESLEPKEMDSLNTDRVLLNALKALTWTGRLTYIENPTDAETPFITWGFDWRFVEPTQKEYAAMAEAAARGYGAAFKDNQLGPGHINYLVQAIEMLYTSYRREDAQELLDYIKKAYDPAGPEWSLELEDFVIWRMNFEGQPNQEIAYGLIGAALRTAYVQRVLGDPAGYAQSVRFARRVYDAYSKGTPSRMAMPPMDTLARDVLVNLLVRPRPMGVNLSLVNRADLYKSLDIEMQQSLYDMIWPLLRPECQAWEIDFDKAFPEPPGMEQVRQVRQRQAEQQPS